MEFHASVLTNLMLEWRTPLKAVLERVRIRYLGYVMLCWVLLFVKKKKERTCLAWYNAH